MGTSERGCRPIRTVLAVLCVLLIGSVTRAQADPITWRWDFTIGGGSLLGAQVFGSVTYDDAALPNPLNGGVPVTDLSLNVGTHTFNLADAVDSVVFFDPRPMFTGFGILNYQVRPDRLFGDVTELSLSPGGNLFFLYRTGAGANQFTYIHQAPFTPATTVPEPDALPLVAAGVMLFLIWRKARAVRSMAPARYR